MAETIATLSATNDRLVAREEELAASNADLVAANAVLTTQVEERESTIEALRASNDEMSTTITDLREGIASLTAANASLTAANIALAAELATVRRNLAMAVGPEVVDRMGRVLDVVLDDVSMRGANPRLATAELDDFEVEAATYLAKGNFGIVSSIPLRYTSVGYCGLVVLSCCSDPDTASRSALHAGTRRRWWRSSASTTTTTFWGARCCTRSTARSTPSPSPTRTGPSRSSTTPGAVRRMIRRGFCHKMW